MARLTATGLLAGLAAACLGVLARLTARGAVLQRRQFPPQRLQFGHQFRGGIRFRLAALAGFTAGCRQRLPGIAPQVFQRRGGHALEGRQFVRQTAPDTLGGGGQAQ